MNILSFTKPQINNYSTSLNYGMNRIGNDSYHYPVNNENDTAEAASSAVLLQAMALGLQKLSEIFSKKLSAGQEFTSSQNVFKTAAKMVKDNKLNIDVGFINEANKDRYIAKYGGAQEFDVVAKGQNAFFTDELKIAVAPESKPSLILHELGHAINAKKKFTKLLQQSRRYAMFAPTALLIANKLAKGPSSEKKTFIERYAGMLGFCAFLPTIIEEGLASLRGINAAKTTLGKIPTLKILKKNYAFALGTYILSGIGLGIAAKQTIDEDNRKRLMKTGFSL